MDKIEYMKKELNHLNDLIKIYTEYVESNKILLEIYTNTNENTEECKFTLDYYTEMLSKYKKKADVIKKYINDNNSIW